jgi:hypothetical protein
MTVATFVAAVIVGRSVGVGELVGDDIVVGVGVTSGALVGGLAVEVSAMAV